MDEEDRDWRVGGWWSCGVISFRSPPAFLFLAELGALHVFLVPKTRRVTVGEMALQSPVTACEEKGDDNGDCLLPLAEDGHLEVGYGIAERWPRVVRAYLHRVVVSQYEPRA